MQDLKCLSPSDFVARDSWPEFAQLSACGKKRVAGISLDCMTCLWMFLRVVLLCTPLPCRATGRGPPEKMQQSSLLCPHL